MDMKMHRPLSHEKLEAIHNRFEYLRNWAWTNRNHADVKEDGIVDLSRYERATKRILWILKQDWYSGDIDKSYSERVKTAVANGKLPHTWRRMGYVSYGILNNLPSFNSMPSAIECGNSLLDTAIIEVDKELGESRSPDAVILDGFHVYWPLVKDQIRAYDPDVIIVGMPGALRAVPEAVFKLFRGGEQYITYGLPCERTEILGKQLLWAYHPNVRARDEWYYESIASAVRDPSLTSCQPN